MTTETVDLDAAIDTWTGRDRSHARARQLAAQAGYRRVDRQALAVAGLAGLAFVVFLAGAALGWPDVARIVAAVAAVGAFATLALAGDSEQELVAVQVAPLLRAGTDDADVADVLARARAGQVPLGAAAAALAGDRPV